MAEHNFVDAAEFYSDPQTVLATLAGCLLDGRLGIVETTRRADGTKVKVLVGLADGDKEVFPIALLFNGQPFDELNPPEGSHLLKVGAGGERMRIDSN